MSVQPPFRRNPGSCQALWPFGLASALVYLLAFLLPYGLPTYYLNVQDEIFQFAAREHWRGILFYVALAALFRLYLAAYRLAARIDPHKASARSIGLWTLVFCLLLILLHPLTSSDVYGYTFQGRLVSVLGENPFSHLYGDFADDPFFSLVTFHGLPATTGYGPLWVAVEAGLGWLARNRLLLNLVLFKGLAAALHLLGSTLVYATLKRRGMGKPVAGMLFYAWNPLLLYELVGNAHNDAALAFFTLLSFYLLSRDKWWAAIPSMAAAVLIKPVAVLWLPLVGVWLLAQCSDRRSRFWRAAAIALLAAAPAVVVYAPFWAGPITFRGLLAQSDIHGNSLPNVLVWGLWTVWPGDRSQVIQAVKLLTVVPFVPFYLWHLWRLWREGREGKAWRRLVHASFDVMLFYLLFVGLQFWPWYLTWLMVPAALLDEPVAGSRRLLVLGLCMLAPLLYFPFGWQWARSRFPGWGLAFVSALPLIAAFAWLGIQAWRRHLVHSPRL